MFVEPHDFGAIYIKDLVISIL